MELDYNNALKTITNNYINAMKAFNKWHYSEIKKAKKGKIL